MIETLLFIALGVSLAVAIISSLGAHLVADYLKRNKIAKKPAPDFVRSAPPPFTLEIGISLLDIFSGAHKIYENSFVSKCVYVARISFVATGTLLLSILIIVIL
jgi:hypothetical protein